MYLKLQRLSLMENSDIWQNLIIYLEYGDFIIKLLSDPKKAEEMGQNFYNFVREKYQWTEISSNLEKLLIKN